jgi:hypothetical protein
MSADALAACVRWWSTLSPDQLTRQRDRTAAHLRFADQVLAEDSDYADEDRAWWAREREALTAETAALDELLAAHEAAPARSDAGTAAVAAATVSTSSAPAPRTYPLPRPDHDPRFTTGLLFDVRRVLAEHGYPEITSGGDLVELQMALFGFLYASADQPTTETLDDAPTGAAVCDGCGHSWARHVGTGCTVWEAATGEHDEGACPCDRPARAGRPAAVDVDDEPTPALATRHAPTPADTRTCPDCGHSQELHTGPGLGCAAWIIDEHDEGAYCACGRQDPATTGQPAPAELPGFEKAGDPVNEEPPTAAELDWARRQFAELSCDTPAARASVAAGWLEQPCLYRSTLRKGLALAAIAEASR